jgi:hypothetical protein
VQPQLQRIEVQPFCGGDDDLAVDHAPGGQRLQQSVVEVGKIAVERALVAALDEDVGVGAEDDRAESVPFRLEQEPVVRGQIEGDLGKHRLDRRGDGGIGRFFARSHGGADRDVRLSIDSCGAMRSAAFEKSNGPRMLAAS